MRTRWLVVVGTTMAVMLGSLGLGVGSAAASHNDNFGSALTLFGDFDFADHENLTASKESGEDFHAGDDGGASVWWNWTAPYSTSVIIDTCESDFDTLLGVYTGGAVDSLSEVDSNDDDDSGLDCFGFGDGTQSLVQFNATAGQTYRIAVDGFDDGSGAETGNIVLVVDQVVPATPPPAPPNDNVASAELIPGADQSSVRDNLGATLEPGELGSCADPNADNDDGISDFGSTVWFLYDPPSAGRATFDVSGGGLFDPVLTVYRVDGTPVGCDDDTGDAAGLSRLQVNYGGSTNTDPAPRLVQIGGFGEGGFADEGFFTYSVNFDEARKVNSTLRVKTQPYPPDSSKYKRFSRLLKFKLEMEQGASALVRCVKKCPFDEVTFTETAVDLGDLFKKSRAARGSRVEIFITKDPNFGAYYNLKFRPPKSTKREEMCIESLSSTGEPTNLFEC